MTYLPGLSRAGSIRSGLLLAPMTNTCSDLLSPSSSANSCDTTLSITPPESPLRPRLGAMESSSSKKMTEGAALEARANTVCVGVCGGGGGGGNDRLHEGVSISTSYRKTMTTYMLYMYMVVHETCKVQIL